MLLADFAHVCECQCPSRWRDGKRSLLPPWMRSARTRRREATMRTVAFVQPLPQLYPGTVASQLRR